MPPALVLMSPVHPGGRFLPGLLKGIIWRLMSRRLLSHGPCEYAGRSPTHVFPGILPQPALRTAPSPIASARQSLAGITHPRSYCPSVGCAVKQVTAGEPIAFHQHFLPKRPVDVPRETLVSTECGRPALQTASGLYSGFHVKPLPTPRRWGACEVSPFVGESARGTARTGQRCVSRPIRMSPPPGQAWPTLPHSIDPISPPSAPQEAEVQRPRGGRPSSRTVPRTRR